MIERHDGEDIFASEDLDQYEDRSDLFIDYDDFCKY